MDLTPRPTPPAARVREARSGSQKLRIAAIFVVVAGALGFLMFKGLSDATLFFRNADEAVALKDELGDRRFRLQGAVVEGTVERTDFGANFDVEHNGVVVPVVHTKAPESLFQAGIRVVLEGRWVGDRFESDEMLVKHSNSYKDENPDRVVPVD